MSTDHDRELGLDRAITRRDFLDGVALPVGGWLAGALVAPAAAAASATSDAPAATVSNDVAANAKDNADAPAAATATIAGQPLSAAAWLHARRDGAPRPRAPAWQPGDETADLVVVGAGISGLAAARLYRQQRPHARVLLLDALPLPGGHAQRNEFVAANGRRVIGYGGSEAMDTPSLWSPAARSLVRGLGIELEKFHDWFDGGFAQRHGLVQRATWWSSDLWPLAGGQAGVRGPGVLVRHAPDEKPEDWTRRLPLADDARADYLRLLQGPPDPFPTLGRAAKRARLSELTYDRLLLEVCGLHRDVARIFNARTRGYIGVGTDATSALDAYALQLPGFQHMDLGDAPDRRMSPSGRQAIAGQDDYIYHFPDGNAGLVRALIRALIPDAMPGTGAESLVLGALDTARLDAPGQPVRLRVEAPVVDVRHVQPGPADGGDPAHAPAVDVAWAAPDGTLHTVRAAHVVLACFHRVIPYLCPELPAQQVAALNDQCKVPLVYANVLVRHWQAFQRAGIAGFTLPDHPLWEEIRLDFPVSIGRYRFPDSPDQPCLLQMSAVVLDGPRGTPEREQCAAGRRKLHAMDFREVERELRQVLNGALGPFGFAAATDIEAITLNRWAHGYAYEYMRPWDAYWPDGPLPIHAARRGWGRIAIANADAGAYAYAHGAIDQATRAVSELLPHARLPAWWTTPGPAPTRLKFA